MRMGVAGFNLQGCIMREMTVGTGWDGTLICDMTVLFCESVRFTAIL